MTVKHVAVVGASGAVGERMIRLLEERRFPLASIKFLASARSAGKTVEFRGEESSDSVELSAGAFAGVEIVLSSTPASVSRQWSPIAAAAGAVVVDNSSAFRMDPDVPLVVPEVNPHDILKHRGIIANPNCSTIQMVVALKPLHDAARVRRVVVSTYQSVSGAGQKGIHELEAQTEAARRGRPPPAPSKFAHPIFGNCIPQIDDFLPNGYTKEEMKMVNETRKIMGDATIDVSPTCVRVPVADVAQRVDPGRDRAADLGRGGPRALGRRARRDGRRRSPRRWPIPWPPPPPARTTSSSAASARTCTGPTRCSSGASATTSARGRPPTPCRSPRSCLNEQCVNPFPPCEGGARGGGVASVGDGGGI